MFLFAAAALTSAQTLARFEPAVPGGGALELRFVHESAQRREARPWPAQDAGWLFVRQEGSQWNFDALTPRTADASVLAVELEGAGPALVGWDRVPRVERTSAAELRAFLAERAAGKALPRELERLEAGAGLALARLESLGLLAGEPGREPAAVAISKGGQRMELRALMDPGALAAGSDFAFKLYLPEGGAENVYCRAVQLDTRAARVLERLADGSVRATLAESGPWMIEAHRLRALDGAQGATLELASVTLVFVVPGAPAKKGGGR